MIIEFNANRFENELVVFWKIEDRSAGPWIA